MSDETQYLPFSIRMPTRYGEFEVSHFEFWNGSDYEFCHQHTCYELYYCLEGSITVSIADNIMELPKYHCFILAPHILHQVTSYKNASYFTMGFSSDIKHAVKKDYYDNGLFVRLEKAISTKTKQQIIFDQYHCDTIIQQIHLEYSQKAWAYKLIIGNLCSNLLFLTLRNMPSALFLGQDMQAYPDNYNTALLITKYIAAHCTESLSLEKVAEEFHLSSRHVNRLLSDYYGQKFNNIINAYRLNQAKELLMTTEHSIDEIAYQVGFSSSRSLYNLFHKYERLSPLEYKKYTVNKDSSGS